MADHRIGRVRFELVTDEVSRAEAWLRDAGRLHERRIAPLLERVCDALGDPDRLDRLDTLEVEVRDLSPDDLEGDLVRKLEPALRAALARALGGRPGDAPAATALELLELFARTGNLTWWAAPRDGDPVAAALGRAVDLAPGELLALLRHLADDAAALARLARHGASSVLTALVARRWSPGTAERRDADLLLAALADPRPPEDARRSLLTALAHPDADAAMILRDHLARSSRASHHLSGEPSASVGRSLLAALRARLAPDAPRDPLVEPVPPGPARTRTTEESTLRSALHRLLAGSDLAARLDHLGTSDLRRLVEQLLADPAQLEHATHPDGSPELAADLACESPELAARIQQAPELAAPLAALIHRSPELAARLAALFQQAPELAAQLVARLGESPEFGTELAAMLGESPEPAAQLTAMLGESPERTAPLAAPSPALASRLTAQSPEHVARLAALLHESPALASQLAGQSPDLIAQLASLLRESPALASRLAARSPEHVAQLASLLRESPELASQLAGLLGESPELASQLAGLLGESPELASQLAAQSPELASQLAALLGESPELASQLAALLGESPELASQLAARLDESPELASQLAARLDESPGLASQLATLLRQSLDRAAPLDAARASAELPSDPGSRTDFDAARSPDLPTDAAALPSRRPGALPADATHARVLAHPDAPLGPRADLTRTPAALAPDDADTQRSPATRPTASATPTAPTSTPAPTAADGEPTAPLAQPLAPRAAAPRTSDADAPDPPSDVPADPLDALARRLADASSGDAAELRRALRRLLAGPDMTLRTATPPRPHPQQRRALERLGELHCDDGGLVLLWPFLERFFARVGLLDDQRRFLDDPAAAQAVGLLHALATGDPDPPEFVLPLAKLLCGLAPAAPWSLPGPLAVDWLAEGERLIASVVDHAAVLGSTSVAGFRAAFLCRPAILRVRDGAWTLHVERQTHDVLLDRFPWGWAWIRTRWMTDPLQVEW